MAECHKIGITTCFICSKTYKNPKYLPCLHTFCQMCLAKHISSNLNKVEAICTIACPICDLKCHLPEGSDNTSEEDYANMYPDNHLVRICVDQDLVKKGLRKCDVCIEQNLIKDAEAWCKQCSEAYCDNCAKVHKAMRISKKHECLPFQTILKDLSLINSKESCEKHPNETAILFCSNHDTICCSLCAMVNHRECNKLTALTEAAKDIKQTEAYKLLLPQLKQQITELKKDACEIDRNIDELNKEKTQLEKSSETLANDLSKHIMHLLRQFKNEISDIHSKALKSFRAEKEMLLTEQKCIESSVIQLSQSVIPDEHIFMQMRRSQETRNKYFGTKDTTVHQKTKSLKCHGLPSLKSLLSLLHIEVLDEVDVVESRPSSVMEKPLTKHLKRDVKWMLNYTNPIAHENNCYYHTDGCIFVLCVDDRKLYLYTATGIEVSVVTFVSKPFGITMAGSDIMVSFPELCSIYTYSLVSGRRVGSNKNEIKIGLPCYGIAGISWYTKDDGIIVACDNKLVVVNSTSGQCLRTIPLHLNGFRHIACHDDRVLYITNSFVHRVVGIDVLYGNTLFTFEDYANLKVPCGITADSLGDLYVVGCLSKNVVKISEDGKYKGTLLDLNDGLYHPNDIAFVKQRSSFVLTNDIDVFVYSVDTIN